MSGSSGTIDAFTSTYMHLVLVYANTWTPTLSGLVLILSNDLKNCQVDYLGRSLLEIAEDYQIQYDYRIIVPVGTNVNIDSPSGTRVQTALKTELVDTLKLQIGPYIIPLPELLNQRDLFRLSESQVPLVIYNNMPITNIKPYIHEVTPIYYNIYESINWGHSLYFFTLCIAIALTVSEAFNGSFEEMIALTHIDWLDHTNRWMIYLVDEKYRLNSVDEVTEYLEKKKAIDLPEYKEEIKWS